jgi:hypothetical protein
MFEPRDGLIDVLNTAVTIGSRYQFACYNLAYWSWNGDIITSLLRRNGCLGRGRWRGLCMLVRTICRPINAVVDMDRHGNCDPGALGWKGTAAS